MSEKVIFETVLEKHATMDATGITIPFDVETAFGARRVPVKVRINGAEYRSTIVRMNGRYMMVVPKAFREAAGIAGGDFITVEMERDTEKRTVEVPPDFAAALKKADLTATFSRMSFTHRKEYVSAVCEAKREETRSRRIAKAIEEIAKKKK